MIDTVTMLISASKELASYIDKENKRLKSKICSTDLDDPDYHDYQTCYELDRLAAEIRDGINTNNESQTADDEHALNRFK